MSEIKTSTSTGKKNKDGLIGGNLVRPKEHDSIVRKNRRLVSVQEQAEAVKVK